MSEKLSEDRRQALLRFVDFEADRIDMVDDATLLILYAALSKCRNRDPKRHAIVLSGMRELLADPTPSSRE